MSVDAENIPLMEEMYERYLANPASVDPAWQHYFSDLEHTPTTEARMREAALLTAPGDLRIYDLIDAYRQYGHLLAKINPIATHELEEPRELTLEELGFHPDEMNKLFPTCGLLPQAEAPLKEIIATLREIYCDKIGVEYMGLQRPELEKWLQQKIEPNRFKIQLTIDQKKMILQNLNKSELLESFLHTKYVGQKRFSLEGAETLIPILEAIIETGTKLGQREFILGMAHRGRINVLSNILNKSYTELFSEFEEGYIPESFEGSGDVKYHKGFFSEVLTVEGQKLHIVLTPNPSHLESVDPVVEGQARAKQIQRNDTKKEEVLPLLVHGDAALAGQGIIYETLQLYNLKGYSTGGTIHVVINNQIGFTTLPEDARSTRYCTDIARAFGAPVFHVDAEDPEGCVYATILAAELRQKFHCEVFIDLNCYRKYGHNETDEPAFTQPLEYQLIRKKKGIREIYRDDLIQQGILERKMAEALEVEFKKALQEALAETKAPQKEKPPREPSKPDQWDFSPVKTGVPVSLLQTLADRLSTIPEGFTLHPKLEALIKDRLAMVKVGEGSKPMDWGMGETLAYASLLWEGISVRLSGQDTCRGTFSHRHGMWMDQVQERAYFPLQHLKEGQGRFDLINSPLSEYAVLGFEYGYSIALPEALVLWEAQFGDFANGAQVIIDQYLSTGEQKWGQKSGLVLLLPHGYEGQGPEHSSARIERFLTLCGNDNMVVVNPTTPAQLFHLLRREMVKPVRKPLIVFTPKGLLRHPKCVSSVNDLAQGSFQEILEDPAKPSKVKKLVFCSGRIYYDLIAEREKQKRDDIAITRVEQLYPLHAEKLQAIIKNAGGFDACYWVQEEPFNMGAWHFIGPILQGFLPKGRELHYIGRERSASPAVGSYAMHKNEHAAILNALFQR